MKKILSTLLIAVSLITTIGAMIGYKESPYRYEYVEKIVVDDNDPATVWLEYGDKIFDGTIVVHKCNEKTGEEIVLETSGNYELYAYVKK